MARVYNRKDGNAPPNAVNIMRGGPYGNRFRIGEHGPRATVLRRFACEQLPEIDVRPLIGRDLVCCCAPLPCHGDYLLSAARAVRRGLPLRYLIVVRADHFTAALVSEHGRCIEAAPILKWTIGKPLAALRERFEEKGWRITARFSEDDLALT